MARLPEILQRMQTAAGPAERAGFCEEALAQLRREDDPILWGNLQGALASSLAQSSGRRLTSTTFERILKAYESALTVFTPAESPEEWSATLRNIGRTHTDAVESGLGDVQDHVEAAIAAFARAATIAPRVDWDQWVGAHCDLAEALRAAAPWRGTAAFDESAKVYGAVLGGLTRDAAPELWASLNVAQAEVLVAAGDVSRAGEAILAGERALEVYTYEANPVQWAQVQLMLGELFRARSDGDRADNLERAATALDAALRVYTQDAFPDEWLRAHYQRGPVLVFRTGGDRNENLRRALESLRIAAARVPSDQAPEMWASLQVTIAQALLDRTDGDAQEHVESAIAALHAALPVLDDENPSLSWILAHRFLADAYLRRERGDADDNLERGIQALEAVQRRDWPPADFDAWTTAQANLGQAYARRRRGDRGQNRANAIAALDAAVSAPSAASPLPQGWGDAQAWLTLLAMHAPEYDFPQKRANDAAGQEESDFNRGVDALRAFHAGESPLALDPDWHVPFQLEEAANDVQRLLPDFLTSGAVPRRSVAERAELEIKQHAQALLLIYHLKERQSARRRTEALFRDVLRDGRPFVLFLRGFNNRIARFPQGSVVSGTGNLETFALTDLVASVAPMPVVWILNPVESPAIDLMISGKMNEDAMGFRVEAGAEWEQHVRTLISAAAYIVMHNKSMTPGVAAEIAGIAAAGRLEDTFFADAEAANRATGRFDCRQFDADAVEAIRARTTPASLPPALPPAMCPWVGGARRIALEREAQGVEQLLGRLDAVRQPVLADLALDASAWRLGHAVLLERPDHVADALAQRAALFEVLAGELDQAPALAAECARLATQLAE